MKIFKRNLGLIFKGLLVMALLLGLGLGSNEGSAHRIHHHVRIGRVTHRKHYRHGSLRLLHRTLRRKRSHNLSTRQINRDKREVYGQTIKDVNRDRRRKSLPNLRVDRQLSRIGNVRSKQLIRYFSHNTKDQPDEAQHLLNQLHVKYQAYGENIASSPLGRIAVLAVGPYSSPNDANSKRSHYYARNGVQLANNINDASMYHDAGDQNGHRANDLDPNFTKTGVGVTYNRRDHNFYIAMEFIG